MLKIAALVIKSIRPLYIFLTANTLFCFLEKQFRRKFIDISYELNKNYKQNKTLIPQFKWVLTVLESHFSNFTTTEQ